MIGILASQLEAMYALIDILKSRGVADADDFKAFWEIRPPEARKETVERAHRIYAILAENVGIDTRALGIAPTP